MRFRNTALLGFIGAGCLLPGCVSKVAVGPGAPMPFAPDRVDSDPLYTTHPLGYHREISAQGIEYEDFLEAEYALIAANGKVTYLGHLRTQIDTNRSPWWTAATQAIADQYDQYGQFSSNLPVGFYTLRATARCQPEGSYRFEVRPQNSGNLYPTGIARLPFPSPRRRYLRSASSVFRFDDAYAHMARWWRKAWLGPNPHPDAQVQQHREAEAKKAAEKAFEFETGRVEFPPNTVVDVVRYWPDRSGGCTNAIIRIVDAGVPVSGRFFLASEADLAESPLPGPSAAEFVRREQEARSRLQEERGKNDASATTAKNDDLTFLRKSDGADLIRLLQHAADLKGIALKYESLSQTGGTVLYRVRIKKGKIADDAALELVSAGGTLRKVTIKASGAALGSEKAALGSELSLYLVMSATGVDSRETEWFKDAYLDALRKGGGQRTKTFENDTLSVDIGGLIVTTAIEWPKH